MSNRISGFTVTFENSVSEEYMDMVQEALKLYKGVIAVDPIVEDSGIYIGQSQEMYRIKNALLDLLKSDFGSKK